MEEAHWTRTLQAECPSGNTTNNIKALIGVWETFKIVLWSSLNWSS